ncbi:NAD(P)-dependent oxidoreductase [Carnobacteriaceae bacterium zg-ZUI252]|nr:NAD(P)-dependent oxidoreductase [Carnobacteriaceae bacterium zg-ZUI252]MBS4770234.1 NAD(P)-dependent oxidoreductase [Carnobacteriaceae bacterium zg-ZUI240]QTU83408.1 NAD(P)-dependent oxidoreductase [Carnobacteriaceae bacterium zg-C25]
MKKIGFIGLGVMGNSIVKHLLNEHYTVFVYTRTKVKAIECIEKGAQWCASPADVTQKADVILTMVGYPSDVENVYFDETNGIFSQDVTGKYLIDLTTSTPTLAQRIADYAQSRGAFAMDAPVSGGDTGAKNGMLTTMVGSSQSAFEAVLPILNVFSSKVKRQGNAGAGQHTKMANQIMIAGTMTGMTELLVYAKAAGLNAKDVLETVGAGSAGNWSLSNYGPRILNDDFAAGFYVKHFVKDLRIALEESKKLGIELPATQQAERLYHALLAAGFGDNGTQSLIKVYTKE